MQYEKKQAMYYGQGVKLMKKFFSLTLVIVMLLSASITALATDSNPQSDEPSSELTISESNPDIVEPK